MSDVAAGDKLPAKSYESWGRYPSDPPKQVVPINWRGELPDLSAIPGPVLPYAYGRSYGDSCLNRDGTVLDVSGLRRFIDFDPDSGLLTCEAGVRLDDILNEFVPRGWFLPVSPGTKFVSVGGAIANDIHGKNHGNAGTWGRHVRRFELVRSSGERIVCSPNEHRELYRATIGGLGLTGLITWAEIQLKTIVNPYMDEEQLRFTSLDEFLALTAESEPEYEYTVSWADCLGAGAGYVRGHFIRGNHNQDPGRPKKLKARALPLMVPVDLPSGLICKPVVRAFNSAYFHRQRRPVARHVISYDPFFYPLDAIKNWNRGYGKRGFLQYQCVVPFDNDNAAIKEIFQRIHDSGLGSPLTVLKTFGDLPSPGMLSFPRPGITFALDFPFQGKPTLDLLETLDAIVRASGGAVYPAKDARMSAESFQAFFPSWKSFSHYIDPCFSSSFWRRVTGQSEDKDGAA